MTKKGDQFQDKFKKTWKPTRGGFAASLEERVLPYCLLLFALLTMPSLWWRGGREEGEVGGGGREGIILGGEILLVLSVT